MAYQTANQRQAFDQRAQVRRRRVQRDEDEIGECEQIRVDGADRGCRVDDEIGGAGFARAPPRPREIGKGEGGIAWRIDAGLFR